MMSEKVARTLKNLGLTEYEARVYTGLVSVGPTSAGELSDTSNVPYSRIYDVLSKLERKGWIEIQSGRPTRYRAKSPSEALRLAQIEQEQEFKEASETILRELEPIYEQKAEMKKPDIWVIRGTRNLIGKIGEMSAHAQMEILITIPTLTKDLAGLQSLFPALNAKSLKIQLLTSKRRGLVGKLKSLPNLEVRYREPLFGGGVIVDSKEVLLLLGGKREKLGIWSDEISLVKYAKEYFEYLWKDSRVA